MPQGARLSLAISADQSETVTVTETVCSTHSPGKVTETSVVVTPAPGTVPHSTAPSETTNTAGATGVGLPTTLVTATLPTPLVTTTGPTAKPVVTSETKTGMTTGPAPVSTSITHAGNTTQTAAPTHTSGMSTTGGAATGASGTETTSATSQTNSAPVKAAGSNPVRALAVGLLLFAAL